MFGIAIYLKDPVVTYLIYLYRIRSLEEISITMPSLAEKITYTNIARYSPPPPHRQIQNKASMLVRGNPLLGTDPESMTCGGVCVGGGKSHYNNADKAPYLNGSLSFKKNAR